MSPNISLRTALAAGLALLSFGIPALADDTATVTATIDGQQVSVPDDRQPALFTGNFGDCMGSSSVNVTRFDAAYYKDNMTVLFHLAGETALTNEAVMMYIGVYAYGESRFDLTFNPCSANIASACPIKAGVPIEANGIIPIAASDVANIPSIALSIPDFEGEAILRIFANSTQSEIACFSAVVTNGQTFSQPAAVGSVLGIFTIIAILSSFATAVYGDSIPVMRKHYSHSLSVLVVFAVWHHIFFSGALSMNWPSVLVAFWSNYAWAGGMIYSESMQNSINNFIGSNKGNTSQVGAAGVGQANPSLGGGYDIHSIYKRSRFPSALNVPGLMKRSRFNRVARHLEESLSKRDMANRTSGYSYYGNPVKPGLPLPGNYSGFAGTLAQENIPASNAFMTGFLWFLILLVIVAFVVVAFKFILEGLSKVKWMKNERLTYFRSHWLQYTALAVLRTLVIGFFMIIFLCLFQFSYLGEAGPVAVASIVFLIMLFGLGGLAGYACFYRIKFGNYVSHPDRLNVEKKKVMKVIPWFGFRAASKGTSEDKAYAGSLPWFTVRPASNTEKSIHDDDDFTKKFGWLAARFRGSHWWFFAAWMVFEFIRACFLAGASGHSLTQVFGLLVVEFIGFIGMIIMRPFEGQRLNLIVVYLLGFSKVVTVALSAAFDVRFNLARIPTTAIGIVIIVIQGILTIIVLIAIVVGAISSYFSIMRNRKQEDFHPKRWATIRERYYDHLDGKKKEKPAPPPTPEPEPERPKEPYFSVNSLRRMPKIEDEDAEFVAEIGADSNPSQSQLSLGMAQQDGVGERPTGRSRAASRAASVRSQMSYTSLPYGARVHRPSWSTRDFNEFGAMDQQRRRSNTVGSYHDPASRPVSRTPLSALDLHMATSSENVDGVVSPLPSRPITPVERGQGSNESPVPRSRSRGTNKSPRPQLHTVLSADEVPALPSSPKSPTGPAL